MKASSYHYKTLKDAPSDTELVSHKLMIRAGMIKPIASGIYSWLPLGLKILRKIENIVLTWIENVDEHKEQGDQHGHSTRHDFWWNQKTDPWYHHEQTCKEIFRKLQKSHSYLNI